MSNSAQFKCLGEISDIKFGKECSITREPWPFFDVKGGGLEFGNHVTISSGVHILTHDHHFELSNWRDLDEITPDDPTIIDDYVFIGINAIIMPSCKYVGKHSVIGAGSVVTRDIPPYQIWAGNPARHIGDVKSCQ